MNQLNTLEKTQTEYNHLGVQHFQSILDLYRHHTYEEVPFTYLSVTIYFGI